MIAFLLVNTAPSQELVAYRDLCKCPEVVEIHPLFGEFDMLLKIESADYNAIGRFVLDSVRSNPAIIDTKVLTGPNVAVWG